MDEVVYNLFISEEGFAHYMYTYSSHILQAPRIFMKLSVSNGV